MLRLLAYLIVLSYTCAGALLVADGSAPALGLVLVMTGLAWLVVDVLRRTRVI